jgi:hypothetical protein
MKHDLVFIDVDPAAVGDVEPNAKPVPATRHATKPMWSWSLLKPKSSSSNKGRSSVPDPASFRRLSAGPDDHGYAEN